MIGAYSKLSNIAIATMSDRLIQNYDDQLRRSSCNLGQSYVVPVTFSGEYYQFLFQ
jgi:hypothetical protein